MRDYIGAFAVTAGIGADDWRGLSSATHDDYNAILVKALADRLAEAFAAYLHAEARREWGLRESVSDGDILTERHRGIRPGFGYPACPDHSEKFKLFELLGASELGINLTEHAAMRRRRASAASISCTRSAVFQRRPVGRRSDCRVCEAQGLQFRGCRALADLATGLRAGELLMAAG